MTGVFTTNNLLLHTEIYAPRFFIAVVGNWFAGRWTHQRPTVLMGRNSHESFGNLGTTPNDEFFYWKNPDFSDEIAIFKVGFWRYLYILVKKGHESSVNLLVKIWEKNVSCEKRISDKRQKWDFFIFWKKWWEQPSTFEKKCRYECRVFLTESGRKKNRNLLSAAMGEKKNHQNQAYFGGRAFL